MRQVFESNRREPPEPVELPSRSLERDGEGWIARQGGQAHSGTGSDPRAPLLLLFFARDAEPERLVLEALVAGADLESLTDEALRTALGRARPYQEVHERQEIFPDTRQRGGHGR